jgi:hypothetical protein
MNFSGPSQVVYSVENGELRLSSLEKTILSVSMVEIANTIFKVEIVHCGYQSSSRYRRSFPQNSSQEQTRPRLVRMAVYWLFLGLDISR